jgi:hypothetical protein
MAKWEYAYINYETLGGDCVYITIITSQGATKYSEKVPRKVSAVSIIRQQIANMCGQGWEIFSVTPSGAGPIECASAYHFRRTT